MQIDIRLKDADARELRAILLKARASELSDMRRNQVQLTVYQDRRAGLSDTINQESKRIAFLDSLLEGFEDVH